VNINRKGAVRFEPPPDRCNFQDAVVNFSAEKIHKHPKATGKSKAIFSKFKGDKKILC
jgi:hypothetical protein